VLGRPARACAGSTAPVAYDWSSPATAGLWRVDVREGGDADPPPACSYFVKLIRHVRLWPGLAHVPEDMRAGFVDYFPWQAELDMHASGISGVLPDGMRTPVLHHVKYIDGDHIALWWEFIEQREGSWQLADYRQAAYLLGRLAARRRTGAEVNRSLPAVCHDRTRGSSLRTYTETRVMVGALPALRAGSLWQHPLLAEALVQAADPRLPDDMLALADQLPQILDLLDGLPQTHAHGDASPQNLLLPGNEPGTVVVIDWGFGTLLPVGFDLGQLLVGLAHAGECDPAELAAIDAVIFPAYREGLETEGYEVAPDVVRTGYIGGLAARSALVALPFELLYGAPGEDALTTVVERVRLTRVLLDLVGELEVE
jgi:Phosphotransferase enzyme family